MLSVTGQFFVPAVLVLGALFMILCEQVSEGRNWPRVKYWWARVIGFNIIQAAILWLMGCGVDNFMRSHRPWALDTWCDKHMPEGWGLTASVLIAYLITTFIYYWWHRWRHEVTFLWNWLHQFHHSPAIITVVTSFYKSPYEILANGVIISAILYGLVGLNPYAGTLTMLVLGFAEFFYHWNVKTPVWIGYIIQRPESHCVHHEEGYHRMNFSDIPLWDMLFGTFFNPSADYNFKCGFGEAELDLKDMMLGRNAIRQTGVKQHRPKQKSKGSQGSKGEEAHEGTPITV